MSELATSTVETGSTPTDAHLALNALLTRVLLEVARQRQDELPGLTETLQDLVLVTTGGATRKGVGGWFQSNAWLLHQQPVHEVFFNADLTALDLSISHAETAMVILLHEGCHAYAEALGIKDTSRDGRYHNRRFAEIAWQIGLEIERDPRIGHRTPRVSARGRQDYADLLSELEQGLILAREPRPARPSPGNDDEGQPTGQPGSADSPASTSKYVFATCGCRAGRGRSVTIRVARGSWRPGVIRCAVCGSVFEESLTGQRQLAPGEPMVGLPDAVQTGGAV